MTMLKPLALAAILTAGAFAAHAAAPTTVTLEGSRIFPESIASTRDGTLYVGSYGTGAVYRIRPGDSRAGVWIDPARSGIKAALGVFADEGAKTLYVCSISPQEGPRDPANAALYAFDLATGAQKARIAMPEPDKAVCNDMDIGKDGALYVTDTGTASVYRLRKGASALETWVKDDRLAGIDGLAFAGDGSLYVNTVTTSKLFHIAVTPRGEASTITELKPSMPIAGPDGMRSLGGNRFLLAENSTSVGRIDEVTVNGDVAAIRVIKVDPGVTGMALVGDTVWINNAKFDHRVGQPKAAIPPEPFTIYAVPLR
jgi:sugar lactone lactonase YvrE